MTDDPYHYIKSRTPEQRRAERDARDVARRQANQKGADGIRVVRGNTIQPGTELTDPAPFGTNNGGSGANNIFIINNNGVAEYWSVEATYIGAV